MKRRSYAATRNDDRLTVITTPAPTPNGALHLGHLGGPFVAGDIAARAARARGERVRTVTGLDSHQNYVLTKAEALGRPVRETRRGFGTQIREAFIRARVSYDIILDPAEDAGHRDALVRMLSALVKSGGAVVTDMVLQACGACGRTLHHAYVSGHCPACGTSAGGEACEGCAGYLTPGTLAGARSTCCDAVLRRTRAWLPALRLEAYRERLLEVWARAELPPRVTQMIDHQLDRGLPDVPLAYPTDWGVRLDGADLGGFDPVGLRVDPWAEIGLGYLYAVARDLDPAVHSLDDCVAAWEQVGELWHFLGIDNAFYYAVLYPALFAAAGLPGGIPRGLVVNEFYTLYGRKFSTGRDHAIWALDFLEREDPGIVRLFLSYDRPDRYESDFTMESYRMFRDRLAAGTGTSAVLDPNELSRAEHALGLSGFDPALAVRCLFPALAGETGDPRARSLISALTGKGPDASDEGE